MIWRDFLTTDEVAELARIDADKKAGQAQVRRIYDRCRKRMRAKSEPRRPDSQALRGSSEPMGDVERTAK